MSITSAKAIWACRNCKTARQWGGAKPDDPKQEPLLNCSKCQSQTAHVFIAITHEYSTDDLPRTMPLVRPALAPVWNGAKFATR